MHHRPRDPALTPLEAAWAEREIARLLQIGTLQERGAPPRRMHRWRLTGKKGPKLFRMVINMIPTNRYLKYVPGRYDDVRFFLGLLGRGSFFMSRDLVDAYFHVNVHPLSRELLGFAWRARYFVFLTLPFGLSDSAGVFTTVYSALVDHWRRVAVPRIGNFFDDLFWAALTAADCLAAHEFILREARTLGLTFDPMKGNLAPTQQGVVLGFLVDTRVLTVSIPAEALARIRGKAEAMLGAGAATARQVYSLAASLMTYKRACMLAAPHAYALYSACDGQARWDRPFALSPELRAELEWARVGLPFCASRRFGWEPAEIIHLQSDASATGCCLVQVDPASKAPLGPEQRTAFTVEELALSSNNRELRTLVRGLECFGPLLRGKACRIEQDNSCSVAYATKGGGPVPALRSVTLQLFETALRLGTDLLPAIHIPRALNARADLGSREFETEDYALCELHFVKLSKRFGPFRVDRFADDFNTKLAVFNSRWLCPGAAAVDAFSQTWGAREYLFPPLSRLADVVDKVLRDRSSGMLVAPRHLPALQPFWQAVLDWKELPPGAVLPGPSRTPAPLTSSGAPLPWTALSFDAGRQ